MELRINELLKERGMRMADLAKKLRVDHSNLSSSLKGNPTLSTLREVAAALGVEVRELFPGNVPSRIAGNMQIGDRHFAIIPINFQEKPYVYFRKRFFTSAEQFVLHCLKNEDAVKSLSGLYEGVYPFALLYDGNSKRLFFSFSPNGSDCETMVYDPQNPSIVQQCYTDEMVAEFIARNIVNDIEEMR